MHASIAPVYILGELQDTTAVPALIEALITTHRTQIGAANPGSIGAAFDPNGGGGGLSVGSKPQIVTQVEQNLKVLTALEKLTQRNYGFNVLTWKNWYAEQNKTPVVGGRRD